MTKQTTHHTYLIIGGGPAGLQLGYYFEKAGHDYLILEGGERPGSYFERMPRHGKLISINKVHTGYDDPEVNMRFDWNSLLTDDYDHLFKDYSHEYMPPAQALVDYLGDYAKKYDIKVQCNARVERVHREGALFELSLADGRTMTCDRLISATGFSKPYIPDIPGIELTEQYTDMSVDPEDFANQRVLVIGKGNSGFETVDNLIGTTAVLHILSPHPLKFAWKTHFVGHLRAINNNFLDTYQLKSQNAILDATIEKITKNDEGQYVVSVGYSHAQGEHEELVYDRVLCCTGFRFDASIYDESCKPEMVIFERFPAQTSSWESTNVPDLFFAGTVTQMRDFKKTTSGFIHGFRYNVRALFKLLEKRYHEKPLPGRTVDASADGLVDAMLERINRTSGLWQQFGFLGDVLTISEDRQTARYIEELPVEFIHENDLGRAHDYFILTLEFGKVEGDPFAIQRYPDPQMADESVFLHPVIRHYTGATLLGEHHVLENLYGEWFDGSMHREPLLEFVRHELDLIATAATTEASARQAIPA